MEKAKIGHNQSIIDFAIQHCGAPEMAFDVALANGISITDELVAGDHLLIPLVINQPVVDYMSKNKVKPATGKTIEGDEVIVTYPYDFVSNVASVFSMRRTKTSYEGNIVRVRRSLDGDELEIPCESNGDLSKDAIIYFCGIGHGQVVKWYDQGGNGHDLTQGVVSNMPYIYYNGSMILMNGKPCIDFHNTSTSLAFMTTTINASITSNPYTVFGEFRWSTSANGEHTYLFDNYSNDSSRSLMFSNSGGLITCFQSGAGFSTGVSRPTEQCHFYYLCNGASSEFGINGAAVATGDVGASNGQKGITLGFANIAMGGVTDVFEMEGQVQELVWINGNKSASRATIETILTDYYE